MKKSKKKGLDLALLILKALVLILKLIIILTDLF